VLKRTVSVRMVAAFSIMLSPAIAFSQQKPPTVLIQVDVDTAYDDSPRSLELIEKLLDKLPSRTINVPTGTSPSRVILDNFRVSKFSQDAVSYRPNTYDLIERSVLQLNGVTRPEDLPAGKLRIPGLPTKALTNFNPGKALNALPKISLFGAELMSVPAGADQPADLTLTGEPELLEAGRPASQSTVVDIEVAATEAAELFKDEGLSELIRAFNYPVTVNLATCASPDPSGPDRNQQPAAPVFATLSPADATELGKMMGEAKRQTSVFVLDTGWPSQAAYQYSRNALHEVFDFIWSSKLKLKPPVRGGAAPFQEPSNSHVKSIELALQEFEQQDPKDMVRVVYMPLTKEQGARPMLIELLQLNYLYNLAFKSRFSTAPTGVDVKRAREAAEAVVDGTIPAVWSGQEVKTDKAVIDAILALGKSFAESKQGAFFVNESWTTHSEAFQVYYPSPLRGLVVAAVGNSNEDVIHAFRDFASRSLLHKDTVAVLNTDASGTRLCCTSVLAPGVENETFAVGFDGRVTSATCDGGCGTSFASPRVAWLLGASESLRMTTLDAATWQLTEFQRLRGLRDATKTGLGTFWLGPLQIIKREIPKS